MKQYIPKIYICALYTSSHPFICMYVFLNLSIYIYREREIIRLVSWDIPRSGKSALYRASQQTGNLEKS